MKGVVIRTGINCYRYLVESLRKKAGRSSQLAVNISNYRQYTDKLSHKPMFSKYYLVEVSYKDDTGFFDWITKVLLMSTWIQTVIYVDTRDDFDKLREDLRSFDMLFYDSYAVSDEYLAKYIRKYLYLASDQRIKIDMETAKYIRRRIKYQDYLLDSKLDLLVHTDLSRKTIQRIIPKYRGVKVSTFPFHFFKQDKPREIGSFLSRYQGSISYLYRPMMDFISTWLDLYQEYLSGQLSPMNYLAWLSTSGGKYDIKYRYQLENWMYLLDRYSYELVLTYRDLLYRHRNDSDFNKTLTLFKLMKGLPHG